MFNRLLSEMQDKAGLWMTVAVSAVLVVVLFVFLAATTAGNAEGLLAANNVYDKGVHGTNKTEIESASAQTPSAPTSSNPAMSKKLTATSNEPAATERTGATVKADASSDDATNRVDTVAGQVAAQAVEKPASYVWTCAKDYGGIAPEDGSLSEWAPHYYIAHSYGPYGEVILQLESGDIVMVNGNEVMVQGSVEMSENCSYQEVMNAVGWDATVFQTCIPSSSQNRFVYARGACSTEQAAQEARRWGSMDAEARPDVCGQEVPMEPQMIEEPWAQLEPRMGPGPQEHDRPEQPEVGGRGFVFGG